jgi:hypothetical protein
MAFFSQHVNMGKSHVNMAFFSQHGIDHVNMEHLFLMSDPAEEFMTTLG